MALQPAPLPSIGYLLEQSETNASTGFFFIGPDNNSTTQLLVSRVLSAAYGTYTLTGQDATLAKSAPDYLSPAPLPAIGILLGTDTTSARNLPAVTGGFSIQGQDATFTKGRTLIAETGFFAALGAPAERDLELPAEKGGFLVSGMEATVARGYPLFAQGGADGTGGYFAIMGQQASIAIESTGVRMLPAETGYFSVTTHADNWPGTGVAVSRSMSCDYGTFTLDGYGVTITAPVWRTVVRTEGVWVQVAAQSTTWQ